MKFVEQIYLSNPKIAEEEKKAHIARYEFATKYLNPDWKVLDAACGSGYGSEILSKHVKKVIGIDISSEAIEYAQKFHWKENIEYQLMDLEKPLKFPDQAFNAIISFETLEHLENQEKLISEFKRLLKNQGLLIISVPNKNITRKIGVKNPYHKKELSKEEFIELLSKFFKIEQLYGQIEYISLPYWRKFLKQLIKLDVLKLRKIILRKFRSIKREQFSELIYAPIQKVESNVPSKYLILIAICKKYENPFS